MTRPHYHRLFNWIYLCSLVLMTMFCIGFDYLSYYFMGEGNPLTSLRNSTACFARGCLVLVLPAVITWIITGLIWMTSKAEPLTDEERQKSFVGRLSTGQIFLPLLLVLLIPQCLLVRMYIIYVTGWVVYLFLGVHLLVTWLLTLFLKRITRIRKTARTVVFVVLFCLSGFLFAIGSAMCLDLCSKSSKEYYGQYTAPEDESDAETGDPYPDLFGAFEATPQTLAEEMSQELLEIYDFYDSDPIALMRTAGELLHYDPERVYTETLTLSPDMTGEEVARKARINRENFDRAQHISRYFDWLFLYLDLDGEAGMLDLMKDWLVQHDAGYDYSRFARWVDALDWAYRDLRQQDLELYGEGEEADGSIFYDIFEYASNTRLDWDNYGRFITNPYVRYLAEQNYEDREILLWAYTFWGRRHDDSRLPECRRLLDKVLEAHPNTTYPEATMEEQAALMHEAEERVSDFMNWYKANYWSFHELKVAQYDDNGQLVKFDPEEYERYLHALRKSGFLAPRLLNDLAAEPQADSLQTRNVSEPHGEWLRTDPLISDYQRSVSQEIENLQYKTELIHNPGEMMSVIMRIKDLQNDAGYLRADVLRIDGEWYIFRFLHL